MCDFRYLTVYGTVGGNESGPTAPRTMAGERALSGGSYVERCRSFIR